MCPRPPGRGRRLLLLSRRMTEAVCDIGVPRARSGFELRVLNGAARGSNPASASRLEQFRGTLQLSGSLPNSVQRVSQSVDVPLSGVNVRRCANGFGRAEALEKGHRRHVAGSNRNPLFIQRARNVHRRAPLEDKGEHRHPVVGAAGADEPKSWNSLPVVRGRARPVPDHVETRRRVLLLRRSEWRPQDQQALPRREFPPGTSARRARIQRGRTRQREPYCCRRGTAASNPAARDVPRGRLSPLARASCAPRRCKSHIPDPERRSSRVARLAHRPRRRALRPRAPARKSL